MEIIENQETWKLVVSFSILAVIGENRQKYRQLEFDLHVTYGSYFCLQARPMFSDRRKFSLMADPALEGQYPTRGLYQALAIAAMCVQEQPNMRPLVGDVVTALNYIVSQNYDPNAQSCHHRRTPSSPGVKKDFGSNSKGPVSGDNQSSDSED